MSVESTPAANAVAVTIVDQTVINARALYVGTGGNVAVDMMGTVGGNSPGVTGVVFVSVPSGTILPVSVRRVLNVGAGTTATNIVALF